MLSLLYFKMFKNIQYFYCVTINYKPVVCNFLKEFINQCKSNLSIADLEESLEVGHQFVRTLNLIDSKISVSLLHRQTCFPLRNQKR